MKTSSKSSLSRKDFIKKSGSILAGIPIVSGFGLPNILIPKKKEKLGVALVGLGYYSRDLLAPALQLTEYCELKGIVTGSPSKIPDWQRKYGIDDANVYNYENMHTIADNDDIDVLYIVTPSGLHAKYAIKAAEAGKHVWCEKPMETSVDRCQSIIDSTRKNKVQLTIGYRMQHEPNTQKIRTMVQSGKLGSLQSFTANAGFSGNHQPGNWRIDKELGGGAIFDMGVYPLNAARYMIGEEPISVSAERINNRPQYSEVDEEMHFELEFPSGAIATCKTSFARGMNDLKISGSSGSAELSPFQSYSGVQGKASNGMTFPPFQGNQQAKQMDDDALAIIENNTPLVPGEEGLNDIRVVEAIFESASKSGQKVQCPVLK